MKPLGRYAALNRYVELCESVGLDAASLMQEVGLSPAGLAVQDRWIAATSIARLLELSAAACGREDFGIRMAELRRLANIGPLSLVIREEPTVRSALDILIRYERTYNEALRIRLTEANGLATLRIGLDHGEPVADRQAIELAVGATHQILQSFLGRRWQPASVVFAHSAPADTTTHRRIFGNTAVFDGEFTGIVFYSSDLDAHNKLADELLRPYTRQILDSLPNSVGATMPARTRELIEALLPTGRCSVEQVARSLGIDRRTVHRQLAESGETFTSVLNSVRVAFAERFVANERYSLTEVANLLGFSSLGSFSRWFRSQFDQAPSAWRTRTLLRPDP
ncbi:AraC family transcriptional regulator [Antrihabitans cavernicola]|uniref:AraC family transcriptional regulator n=1 Tax=Antrihabitans cavernicola TaxID=2495913 RepID=A0A5A7S8J3_9NOCA|nr:AraC family transcriptional regulator [Spelaeibacter cavernicola]KAA0022246.1 AraC family transcriptional regulator [Spelaeibacter cavernicola]